MRICLAAGCGVVLRAIKGDAWPNINFKQELDFLIVIENFRTVETGILDQPGIQMVRSSLQLKRFSFH